MTVGVAPGFGDPVDGPVELLFTFSQSTPSTWPNNPLIDDVFRVAGDLGLNLTSTGVEIYNSPFTQYQSWRISVTDDRVSDNYVAGTFAPSPFGDLIKLRLRVDEFGTYAKVWMAAALEPKDWTAFETNDLAVSAGWEPPWIVLQPRQTPNTLGTQTFKVDEVLIVSGAAPPGG